MALSCVNGPMAPPVTVTSPCTRSALASLSVKVMTVVLPGATTVLAALMATVGGTVSMVMGARSTARGTPPAGVMVSTTG